MEKKTWLQICVGGDMRKEYDEYLVKNFPNLYRQRYLSPQETCMCWGFDTGNGWFDLIKRLSEDITKISPETEAVQVKEKFGGLRFYVTNATDEVYKLIEEAENESFKICEKCGSRENVTTEGCWVFTLCDKCWENKRNNPNWRIWEEDE